MELRGEELRSLIVFAPANLAVRPAVTPSEKIAP
jgi:hypothetical protein